MVNPCLILWDVDKTLVDGADVASDIWRIAFERLTGSRVVKPFVPDGSTDAMIMADLAALHALDLPRYSTAEVERAYVDAFENIRDRWVTEARPVLGAAWAIGRIASWPGFVQTVLTGNVRGNAERKLGTLGFGEHLDFDVGAFGSDEHHARADLVSVAQARATAAYGGPFGRTNTILIGDTPRDVVAGHDGGAQVVAVAAGRYDVDTLAEAGPDVVVKMVADVPRSIEALLARS